MTLSEAEAKRQLTAVQYYIKESLNGSFQAGREESTEEYQLADQLRNRGRSVTRYRLYLLTNKALSARAKDFPSTTVDGIPVEFHVWDIERFRRVFESALGREELIYRPHGVGARRDTRARGIGGGRCHDHLSVRASRPADRRSVRALRRPTPAEQRPLVLEQPGGGEPRHP